MTEEERAAAYRAQAERRRTNDLANRRRLAGSLPARRVLEAAWQPIRDWLDRR